MSLLREIQSSLMQEGAQIGPILLKLRYLASKLGSTPLEAWVKYESEGYPMDAELPDYRTLHVVYKGDFLGPFGSAIHNAPIPTYVVETIAGKAWTEQKNRQSLASIESLIIDSSKSSTVEIDASNLILLLQGKIYKGYSCNSVTGSISKAALREIQESVRSRILELTIQIENEAPAAVDIVLGTAKRPDTEIEGFVSQMTKNVIYGNLTNIHGTGSNAQISISNTNGDIADFIATLSKAGIPESDAAELAATIADEKPESVEEPFGPRAKEWIVKNISKAAKGVWKVGVTVATNVISEATKRYYGLN